MAGDEPGSQLAVRGGHGQQLVAELPLRGPALVGVQVGGLGTDHGFVGAQQEAESQDVRGGAGEDEVDAAGREEALKVAGGALRPRVVTVRVGVTVIGHGDHAQDRVMRPCVVVAAEALA